MMSTLIRHPGPPGRLLGLSLVVGLAVRDMAVQLTTAHAKAEAASCNIQVKWPNDVMANGKKIAGILVEARNEGKETGVVIGIGLNLLTLEFPEDLPSASSLALLGVPPEKLSLEHSLALLLQHLETRLTDFFKGGISSLIPELRATDYLLNKKVRIENVTGTGTGLDDSGRLLVNESGSIRAIDSGHVELLSD